MPRAAQNIEFFADWAMTLDGHVIESPEVVNHVKYDPAGVAVLITPWNAPLMLTTWKVGPALAFLVGSFFYAFPKATKVVGAFGIYWAPGAGEGSERIFSRSW